MKRIFDIIFACLILLLISPLFVIIATIAFIDVKGPFFRQKRIGLNERLFYLYKFKSMRNKNEKLGFVTNNERVTKFGGVIRNYSLDELPSLLNIIRGDMSFVGPRPLLEEYLKYYKKEHRRRHNVRPGLTGLAQINGRNNTSWQARLDFDIIYVDKNNLIFDMKILALTFFKVLRKKDVEGNIDLSIIRLDEDENYLKNN